MSAEIADELRAWAERALDAKDKRIAELEAALERAEKVIRPFASAARKYGEPYLAKRVALRAVDPNLPHNYASAVDASAEQTSWDNWDAALEWLTALPAPPSSPAGEANG